ncbi:MAG TPA: prolipoprotein diacylglyceryl transferase family protein, partial [Thermoanaerobaculia bacterium]
MHPELIHIGSFGLPSYGVMMALGFLAGLWLVRRRAPAFGLAPDAASDVGIWLLLSGLVGAKLLLVIVEWPQYVSSWEGLKDLARAGGVFYGG